MTPMGADPAATYTILGVDQLSGPASEAAASLKRLEQEIAEIDWVGVWSALIRAAEDAELSAKKIRKHERELRDRQRWNKKRRRRR